MREIAKDAFGSSVVDIDGRDDAYLLRTHVGRVENICWKGDVHEAGAHMHI